MYREPGQPDNDERRRAQIELDAMATANQLDARRNTERLRMRRIFYAIATVALGAATVAFYSLMKKEPEKVELRSWIALSMMGVFTVIGALVTLGILSPDAADDLTSRPK